MMCVGNGDGDGEGDGDGDDVDGVAWRWLGERRTWPESVVSNGPAA